MAEQKAGRLVAWAKHDPTRLDQRIPSEVTAQFEKHSDALDKYGHVLYAMHAASPNRDDALEALTAFLDLLFSERGIPTVSRWEPEATAIRSRWFGHLMPETSREQISELLDTRRYVILQGPPGTGKTRMARDLIDTEYKARGASVQFHANTTYENFVGGLAPRTTTGDLGFQFAPQKGFLIEAAEAARVSNAKYLLHIDEINRADLAKVLGEAIYLLEADDLGQRSIKLPYKFDPPTEDMLQLPNNLHILGTMNSSDRSLALVDIAVRRRFAFAKLWPQISVVEQNSCELMVRAFQQLLAIFVDHASEESMDLVPGHSYFLEADEQKARTRLITTLKPLLEDYLSQGYVSSFAENIRSYMQWIDTL